MNLSHALLVGGDKKRTVFLKVKEIKKKLDKVASLRYNGGNVDEKIPIYKCKRCGHRWRPYGFNRKNVPIACAKCKSAYWNKERKIKRGKKTVGILEK